LRAVLARGATETLLLDAIDRRGRPIEVRVEITPLGRLDRVAGAVILMEVSEHAEVPATKDS
jgi:hypothetical protein